MPWTSHNLHQNDRMGTDASWDAWLGGLADPSRRLDVQGFGRVHAEHWDMGRRVLPEHMLHFVLAGGHVGTVGEAGGTRSDELRTRRHSLVWIPPGIRQELRKNRERVFSKFYIRFTVAGLAHPPVEPRVRHDLAEALPLFTRLYDECSAQLPGREHSIRALLVLIFGEWRRASRSHDALLDERQRERLLARIDRDPATRLHPATLARELSMAPTWFSRLFRRTFGAAPRVWLVRHRIQLAAQRLLEIPSPVSVVAGEFGYPDVFLFSRQFKAVMGMSPLAWRRLQSRDRRR